MIEESAVSAFTRSVANAGKRFDLAEPVMENAMMTGSNALELMLDVGADLHIESEAD